MKCAVLPYMRQKINPSGKGAEYQRTIRDAEKLATAMEPFIKGS